MDDKIDLEITLDGDKCDVSLDLDGKTIIGSTEVAEIEGVKGVPAKIDTGADSSSVWASEIEMSKEGVLSFCLFGEGSEFFTGEKIEKREYSALVVRSSNGHEQVRYRTKLRLKIRGAELETTFTLADRSRNNFPVLIGRKTLSGKFLVDVSKRNVETKVNPKTHNLNNELKADPFSFHKKYGINNAINGEK